jgi:aminoglycoside phosphotransferase (APT) family kinase protein
VTARQEELKPSAGSGSARQLDERQALASRVESNGAKALRARELVSFEPLPGGHSGLTWRATFALQDGERLTAVVKSTPVGREALGRHDVLRQARAISALGSIRGIPVPEVYFVDEEIPQLFAMAHVAGVGTEPIFDGAGPDEPAEAIAAFWSQAVAILAALAAITPARLGLAAEPVVSAGQEVERWLATACAAGGEIEALAAPLAQRLTERAPAPAGDAVLVHGDYRLGNTLRAAGRIVALIDWEIWSLGDPRTDLGWLMLFTEADAFPELGKPVPGTPDVTRLLADYEAKTGSPVADLDWFRALACFKLAAVQSHNLRRHKEGRRQDPFLESFQASVRRLFLAAGTLLGD